MRKSIIVASLGLAFSSAAAHEALAFDPQFVGIPAPQLYAMADAQAYYTQPLRPQPRPRANYGGGLLEALIGPRV